MGNGVYHNGSLLKRALDHCLGVVHPDMYMCLWGKDGKVVCATLAHKVLGLQSSESRVAIDGIFDAKGCIELQGLSAAEFLSLF